MIDRNTARAIALAEVNKPNPHRAEPLECVIEDQYTREEDFGWVFFYQSREYVETQVFSARLAGNGPIIITREDGSIHRFGSAHRPEQYISEFRERYIGNQ